MIEQIYDPDLKKTIAREILEALREWFEVDESREKYIAVEAVQGRPGHVGAGGRNDDCPASRRPAHGVGVALIIQGRIDQRNQLSVFTMIHIRRTFNDPVPQQDASAV